MYWGKKMIWCETDANDIVVSIGECPDSSIDGFDHFVGTIHAGLSDGQVTIGGRFRNGVFSARPIQPSPAHIWSDADFAWSASVELARSQARQRINGAWKKAETSGFEAYGKVFDSDARAMQRIMGAAQAAALAKSAGQAMSIDWTCKDNSTLTMDTDMLVQVPIFIAQAGAALHAKCQLLKGQIEAATTIEEIDSVVW